MINGRCFPIFGGSKFRGAPTMIVLMAIGGKLPIIFLFFLSLLLSLFACVTGVVKRTIKKTTKFHGARAALKGDRRRSIAARRGARARQFKVTNSAVKGVPWKRSAGFKKRGITKGRKRREWKNVRDRAGNRDIYIYIYYTLGRILRKQRCTTMYVRDELCEVRKSKKRKRKEKKRNCR